MANLKEIEENVKTNPYLKFGLIAIAAIFIGILGLIFVPAFVSAYPAIIGNVGFGLGIFWIVDKYVLKGVNTINEIIVQKNVAYGLLLIAIAMMICASILAT